MGDSICVGCLGHVKARIAKIIQKDITVDRIEGKWLPHAIEI